MFKKAERDPKRNTFGPGSVFRLECTQEEISAKWRSGQNVSGLTPLSELLSAPYLQELKTRAATTNGTSHDNNHYHTTTKNAPLSIDATMEHISKLCNDEPDSIAQNINQAAKLRREISYPLAVFTDLLWDVYYQDVKPIPDERVKMRRANGSANKMPIYFKKLKERLGLAPN